MKRIKIQVITQMPSSKDVQAVQCLLGVANYLAKFLPQLSTVAEPLQGLMDKDVEFDWVEQHEEAFNKIKRLVTVAPELKCYNPTQDVYIECDSSQVDWVLHCCKTIVQ